MLVSPALSSPLILLCSFVLFSFPHMGTHSDDADELDWGMVVDGFGGPGAKEKAW